MNTMPPTKKMPRRSLMRVLVLFLLMALSACEQWRSVYKDIRLPGQLRVVNEGIAHDTDGYWYFSNQHILYKTTNGFGNSKKDGALMSIVLSNYEAIPAALNEGRAFDERYNHIGDVDVFENVLYGGIEPQNGPGVLAKWHCENLTLISYAVTTMDGMPWVAVEASTRLLYSAVWNDRLNLQVFNADTFAYVGVVSAASGMPLPGEIQGGVFWSNSDSSSSQARNIYLAVNANCSIYVMDVASGVVSFVLSDPNRYYGRLYEHIYEMEGIDGWDLRSEGLGVLHVYGNFMEVKEKGIHSFEPEV